MKFQPYGKILRGVVLEIENLIQNFLHKQVKSNIEWMIVNEGMGVTAESAIRDYDKRNWELKSKQFDAPFSHNNYQ